MMQYKTEQVVLKEKFIGHDAKNLVLLDSMLNRYAASGWTLCTMTTTVAGGTGLGGGDRTVFTLIFQKMQYEVVISLLVVGLYTREKDEAELLLQGHVTYNKEKAEERSN